MQTFQLNNGQEIPAIGIGTFQIQQDDCERSIEAALRSGYRLIDTANVYMNEKAVARGMKKSGVQRDEIFLTTKLWPTSYPYEKAKQAIDDTLKRLMTPYLDLLLLHQEVGDIRGAWKAMEEAVDAGKVKSIGVCNFGEKNLKELLNAARIKPVLVQNECHPYLQEKEIIQMLAKDGILLEAWYPLGHADKHLLSEEVFTHLARKYSKSTVQIILRWHTQAGHIVIPGSKNSKHIESNIDIYDFELTTDEMNEIEKLDKNKKYFNVPGFMKKIMFMSGRFDFEKQR